MKGLLHFDIKLSKGRFLTACASLTATTATNKAVCDVWQDLSWSKKDTNETIGEIKVNNARREGWCKGH